MSMQRTNPIPTPEQLNALASHPNVIVLDPPPAFDPYTKGQRLFMMKPPKFMEEPPFAEATQRFINQFKADRGMV